ncbi:MAG: hypothetical protein AAF530_25325 [Pseudomonadota bacterium]
MNWQNIMRPANGHAEQADLDFRPSLRCLRAAAQDAIFAEHGRDIREHLTQVEFDEMVESRATIILQRYAQAGAAE